MRENITVAQISGS